MRVADNKSYKFSLQDIVSMADFSRADFDFILSESKKMQSLPISKRMKLLHGKVIALLFFEPSTRTKLSFASATLKTGGQIIGFDDIRTTSLSKGESFTDTIKMVEKYADVLVIHHPLDGSTRLAADASIRPVINAGDGKNQHPTQALLDLFTIQNTFGKIDGLTIGLCGDLKHYRPFHSLALALSKFKNITLHLISPSELNLPETIRNVLVQSNTAFVEASNLERILPELDVLYMGRIPKEYFSPDENFSAAKDFVTVTKKLLQKGKPHLKVMHPLPRVSEISPEVDDMTHALYFQQAGNGLPVRQALLQLMVQAEKKKPSISSFVSDVSCSNKTCISNHEKIQPKLLKNAQNKLYCYYCGKLVD